MIEQKFRSMVPCSAVEHGTVDGVDAKLVETVRACIRSRWDAWKCIGIV